MSESNNKVIIIKKETFNYPQKEDLFRPGKKYPEYVFSEDISSEENNIYDGIRTLFQMYGLDNSNYGTEEWNPLGEIIKPGDTVLIKPNLVLDRNPIGGVECLYTHPSLIATIIDYVILALGSEGKIIVGDAPLQECDFEKLVVESGLKNLIDYYKKKNIDIVLRDFRNTKTFTKNGMHYKQDNNKYDNGKLIDIGDLSAFAELDANAINNLRVTNYDHRIMNLHHSEGKHEYMVAKNLLQADVVINMPKVKTHRLAGMTCALKNLVGINSNKECLPHHRLGSINESGDAYQNSNDNFKQANELKDIVNKLNAENNQSVAIKFEREYQKKLLDGRSQTHEKFWNGFWYKNDTIWRTITDLNRILIYADGDGKIQVNPQRKILIVGDMVIAGQNEGPLVPSPIKCNTLLLGRNPVTFDRTVCSMMGYDYKLLPMLNNKYLVTENYSISSELPPVVCSNVDVWNHKNYEEILNAEMFLFEPVKGWLDILPSKKLEKNINTFNSANNVYIFGAGMIGVEAYEEVKSRDINITAFVDNDEDKIGKIIIDNIKCIAPNDMNKDAVCLVAAGGKSVNSMYNQAKTLGINIVYKWQEISI